MGPNLGLVLRKHWFLLAAGKAQNVETCLTVRHLSLVLGMVFAQDMSKTLCF